MNWNYPKDCTDNAMFINNACGVCETNFQLQPALHNLENDTLSAIMWFEPNHMKLNSGKCYSLFSDHSFLASGEDANQVKKDLHSLSTWSATWLLEFNADKCHVLTLGCLDNITHTERYKINEEEL